jgi:superfamily II DNA or RNA helicase
MSQDDVKNGVNITNYEKLQHFDASKFSGIVLDESSILKSYSGAIRNMVIDSFARTPYRLACTATPAPNDHMELGNHSEFLGVMKRTEMLASFFVHDGGDTSVWRLKGHAEDAFWAWVCSWAIMMRKPSDLGYSDEGFDLPPCNIVEHIVISDTPQDGMLFPVAARGIDEQRVARRSTIEQRVKTVADLVNASSEPWLVWCELNDEGDMLASSIKDAVQVSGSDSPDHKESSMIGFATGNVRIMVSKSKIAGFGMNFQRCNNMAFVGLSNSYEQFYQAVRRCWRFGQTRPVNVHVVSTDLEAEVLANIKRKEADAQRMAREMVTHMRDLNMASLRGSRREQDVYRPMVKMNIPAWVTEES